MKRSFIVLMIALMLIAPPMKSASPNGTLEEHFWMQEDTMTLSADPGISVEKRSYIILEMTGGEITPHGTEWSQILNASGVSSRVLDVSEILSSHELLDNVPLLLVDASVGSGDGETVSQTMIDLLIRKDISLLLTGRSAWILHRLRYAGPPSLAVPATTVLLESAEYAGAAFMLTPNALVLGSSLTSETGILIPEDVVQTELSRLVELTGASVSSLGSLRFDSMPLDIFLYSPENPTLLTPTGKDFLENIIAFSSALRESETALTIANQQAPAGSLLEGGFSYQHEPTVAATYYTVHSARSLLIGSDWTTWVSQNSGLVQSVLETLVVDFGSETGFLTSMTEGVVHCMSTGQGLWLVSTMGLSTQFNVPEIVSYLSNRQDVDGGFENDIITTYHVTEALYTSGALSSIDTNDLEIWLRSLVIDGGKTSNPDLWGAIGSNPTSLSPTNDFALKYLMSLYFIGKAHPDPDKLTSWILSRTANGDGSFRNSLNPDEEIVTGTAFALSAMQILGTLSSSNKSAGLTWFTSNQLDSGGFGMKPKVSDLVGKTRETSRVSLCLNLLGETMSVIADGISTYLSAIKTDVGFEGMDLLPSLMWTSWILSVNRFSHSSEIIDKEIAETYLSNYVKWTQYPTWDNITTLVAPEYLVSQYRVKSVWTQYFGALATHSLGMDFSSEVISEATLYLSQAQYMTGHYRPTSLMGTAHIQHSVAAIEALFLMDELDTIPYRAALESAMLSEYYSGSWDSTGWTLEPFAGSQEAIDFLSTRAAIRLGIITPAMASEIAATVQARIQYTDLLALSYSVATLSLLNVSAFSVDLEAIDRSQVLNALRSSYFAAGWYNSSILRQPIYTDNVLKMVSILGLRTSLRDVTGNTLTASTGPTATLGSTIEISVSIVSPASTHSLLVNIFDEWTLFENVGNSDILSIPVPISTDSLGLADASIIVDDWGASKAFDAFAVVVEGTITGFLDLDTSTVKMGELINGTADWSLNEGTDAEESQVTIRLGNPLTYQEWFYNETSPIIFSVPSAGFEAGTHNLTLIIEKQFCSDLILQEEIIIVEPDPTYIFAPVTTNGVIDEELTIDWSLHFGVNSSDIEGQVVSIEISNAIDVVIFTDTEVSQIGGNTFAWTPSNRGDYSFAITFPGNESLEGSQITGGISVFETPLVTISLPSSIVAPTTQEFQITVVDNSYLPLEGVNVHCLITLNGSTVYDAFHMTLVDGSFTLVCDIDIPGHLIVLASITQQGWFLDASSMESNTVLGATSISITTPSQPIEQGSILGIVITLLDWSGSPLRGSQIDIVVSWENGTVYATHSKLTDEFGLCTLAQEFTKVGDFVINVTYFGFGLNDSATDTVTQRVFVTPNIEVIHDPSIIVGNIFNIQVGYIDALGAYISGRTISVTIEQNGITVFDIQVQSDSGLVSIDWIPTEGGLATVTIVHMGDIYYLTNSSISTASVLEHVMGQLWMTPSEVDLFDSVTFVYNLTSGLRIGITIHFEVLGMDLVPVWTTDIITNSSGMASVVYAAIHCHGVLRVNAGPTPDQFLIGGDVQEQLIVMTDCLITSSLIPNPPSVDEPTNITIHIEDELGVVIDGLTVTVSLFDPYGKQVKLGYFTMSISVVVIEGQAIVEFTPNMVGLYMLVISSSGSTSIHSFSNSYYHTVYSRTQLQTAVSTHELEVGDTLDVVARLTDHNGNPVVGRNLTLTIDGPGAGFIGPLELVTDSMGYIVWSSTIDDEGLWVLYISFPGLGVYLPVETSDEINVRYGTVVQMDLLNTGNIVAGISPASFSLLLLDTGGTPLEGFTIHYEVYHEILGLVFEGDIIQSGTEPMILNITFEVMGNYTIIASFSGTTHYHASNAALQLWVLGTIEVSAEIPTSTDRSSETSTPISFNDEAGAPIPLSEIAITIELLNSQGPINLTNYFTWNTLSIDFTTIGLPVGLYILNISVASSAIRIGCISIIIFSMTSMTQLEITQENLSGIISEQHSFTLNLRDSLSEFIGDSIVWVSVYNPTGREVYGSPLTDRTPLIVPVSGCEVSWMPALVGDYRIFLEFEGDEYLNATSREFVILVRFSSSLSMEMPELMKFGEVVPVVATLYGALGTISGATLTLTIVTDGIEGLIETYTTDNRGLISINLVGLLSGLHTIRLSFNGSSSQAPCESELQVVITPLVVLSIEPISDMFVGHYCSVNLSVSILGTYSNWTGTLNAWLFDPDGGEISHWSFEISVRSVEIIGFNAQKIGTHFLNMTLSGLPVIVSQDYPMIVVVVDEVLQLELDAGSAPLLGGVGVIAVIGFILRKKVRGVVESLPSDWTE